MTEKDKSMITDDGQDENSDLRWRAEEMLRKQPGELEKIPVAEVRRIFHELEVHQIELDMQNEELRRTQRDLEISNEKYFDLYDLAPVGYITLNEKGIILEANLTAATLLDKERSHLVRQPLVSFIYREDRQVYHLCHKRLVETHTQQACEMRMLGKDGAPFWARIDISTAQGIDGTAGTRAVIVDIAKRKQAENEMENARKLTDALNLELEAANNELEAFSSSVSHDLRAPLRQMGDFAKLLQKRLEGQLDEKALHYTVSILGAAKRMNAMIDDLLAFARLGRKVIQKRKVSLSALVSEAVREISDEAPERDITWKIGELPDVYGDPSLVRLVLVNLISNAVKFTKTRPRAEIEFGSKTEGDEFIFFITDNGAGFNMDYVDRLFGVFQRLHTQDEFEGTGIGLANVRRIISRHGGKTWAEGSVGQGATFYFTLPKTKKHEHDGDKK